jgi:hypothetical protein
MARESHARGGWRWGLALGGRVFGDVSFVFVGTVLHVIVLIAALINVYI